MCSTQSPRWPLWDWTPSAHSNNLFITTPCIGVFFPFSVSLLLPHCASWDHLLNNLFAQWAVVLRSASRRTKWNQKASWIPAFLLVSVFHMSYNRHRHRHLVGLRCEGPPDLSAYVCCSAANRCLEFRACAKSCMRVQNCVHRCV